MLETREKIARHALGSLEIDLSTLSGLGVRLPGVEALTRVGESFSKEAVRVGLQMGLSLRDERLTEAFFVTLVSLALADAEGLDGLTLDAIVARSSLAWMPRSLGMHIARFLLPLTPQEGHWPVVIDVSLVQVALLPRSRGGRAIPAMSHGPYRLNPRYRGSVDLAAARRYLAIRHRPSTAVVPPSTDPAAAVVEADGLITCGREQDAVRRLVAAAGHPTLACEMTRLAVLLRLAQVEMQLGWSDDADRHAEMLELVAGRLGQTPLVAEARHLRALTARQRQDWSRAIALDERALHALRFEPRASARNRQQLDLQRSLGISLSQAASHQELRRRMLVVSGIDDRRWRQATELFRRSIDAAKQLGFAEEVAHSTMRLANHRLQQLRLSRSDEGEIAAAMDLSLALNIPAQAIWERERAAAAFRRARHDRRDGVLEALSASHAANCARGYTHQARLIEELLVVHGISLKELAQP